MVNDTILSIPIKLKQATIDIENRLYIALNNINDASKRVNKKEVYKDGKIYITDPNNLSIYEQQAILTTYCANVNFNSFAAEVLVHAKSTKDITLTAIGRKTSALRADMSIMGIHEGFGALYDYTYYNLDSHWVKEQEEYHGAK